MHAVVNAEFNPSEWALIRLCVENRFRQSAAIVTVPQELQEIPDAAERDVNIRAFQSQPHVQSEMPVYDQLGRLLDSM